MSKKITLNNKFFKILSILSVFVIIFSFLCIPVSAAEAGNYWSVRMPISQPTCTDNFCYIEVVVADSNTGALHGSVFLINAVASPSTSDPGAPYLGVLVSGGTISFSKRSGSPYNFNIFCIDDIGNIWDIGSTTDSSTAISTTYSNNIVLVRYYGFAVRSGNSVVNNVGDVEFTYGSDNTAINYLALILSTLRNQSNSDVTGAINNQTSQLEQNQNANADAIKENQDENTDKILNGWENDTPVDDGDTSILGDIETDLINDNKDSANTEISGVLDNVYGSLQRLSSSFGAVGTMFRQLTIRVPDLNVFIFFSLSIGLIPLIVGMGINGLRASDRRNVKARREADFKRGYNAGYTRGKGG